MLRDWLERRLERWAHDRVEKIDPATCDHEWWVYSTATVQMCLELYCGNCAIAGTVNDPTEDEWAAAFHAPSKHYRWFEPGRVTVGKARML